MLTGAEEDLSLCPNIHVGMFTTTCNSNSMESDSLFWPLLALTVRYIYTQIHAYENKNISLKKHKLFYEGGSYSFFQCSLSFFKQFSVYSGSEEEP